jgi:hypothetical protein
MGKGILIVGGLLLCIGSEVLSLAVLTVLGGGAVVKLFQAMAEGGGY